MSQVISKKNSASNNYISNNSKIPSSQNIMNLYMNKQNNDIVNHNEARISSSSNLKKEGNETYKKFISDIKLNYNLLHPKQRIQTIILHSNLDKSFSVNDNSKNEIDYNNDLNENNNDKLNVGFIMDNPEFATNIHNNNHRRSTNTHLNRINEEELPYEEEKNNQSAETQKNKVNYVFFDNNDYQNHENSRRNLNNIFSDYNPKKEKNYEDKVFLSHNSFNDNPNNLNDDNYSSNLNKTDIYDKKIRNSTFNNLSTNINTNSTKDYSSNDNVPKNKNISSFFNNPNSYQNLGQSSTFLNTIEENNGDKNNNDDIDYNKNFTFMPKEKDKNNFSNNDKNFNYLKSRSLQDNSSYNQYKNNKDNDEMLNYQNNYKNKRSYEIGIKNKSKDDNNFFRKNNFQEYEEYMPNIENNFINKNHNLKDNDINEQKSNKEDISLTISNSDIDDEISKKNKKKNIIKSFFYGLLFGSTASGIFWLKNEKYRKYLWDKIKNINFNSIINLFKSIFLHPLEFFKRIFDNEKMKDYSKIFGMIIGKLFDYFEGYNDWLRIIGIILSVYLIWIIIKSFIKASFKIWKHYN